jgi:NAD(P)-dependent dehydrogenase (short-subunit alcohol dehydrogenase family)
VQPAAAPKPSHGIERSLVTLKRLPFPDALEFALPDPYICLVTDDGLPTTAALVQALTTHGWRVVALRFPQTVVPNSAPLPSSIPQVTLQNFSEDHLQAQLAAIAQAHGLIGAFVHLHPPFLLEHDHTIGYLDADRLLVKSVFFIAKHIGQSLKQAATAGHGCFYSIARLDGAFGLDRRVNFGAIAAGLFGLTKTLNMEWSGVMCRAIDLSPSFTAEQSVACILAELYDPDRTLTEVAYGSQGRVTLTTETFS